MSEDERKQDCETKAFKKIGGESGKGLFPTAYHTAGRQSVCVRNGNEYLPQQSAGINHPL